METKLWSAKEQDKKVGIDSMAVITDFQKIQHVLCAGSTYGVAGCNEFAQTLAERDGASVKAWIAKLNISTQYVVHNNGSDYEIGCTFYMPQSAGGEPRVVSYHTIYIPNASEPGLWGGAPEAPVAMTTCLDEGPEYDSELSSTELNAMLFDLWIILNEYQTQEEFNIKHSHI